MKPCHECGHTNFTFKSKGGLTQVTCLHCSNTFEFSKKKKFNHNERKCKKCGSLMIRYKITLTKEHLLMPSFYTFFYKCKKCNCEVPDPSTKKFNTLCAHSYE